MVTQKETANCTTVYDDVFRTMLDKMPKLVIPLINEVFSEHYSENEEVIALQNEHMELIDDKVITDSYLRIGDKYYHLECQSNPDGTMAIRMIEYDFLIALKHAKRNGYEYVLDYPDSCVLYLRYNEGTPDHLTVHVRFPNGSITDYRTPIIKVNKYQFEEIFEKKLLFFLPYYIMRYEDSLPVIEEDREKLERFLKEYRAIYQKLNEMKSCHQLSDYEFTELKQLINQIVEFVARREEKIRKGVEHMGGRVLEFEHDILMRQSEVRGEARGKAEQKVLSIETLSKNCHVTVEKACGLLGISMSDYLEAKNMLYGNEK